MEIHIDLFGCKDKEDVLLRFGEILQFGGPKGNLPVRAKVKKKGWGINWDAFNDCLRSLDVGGILGSAERIKFPLKITISNYQEFSKEEPKGFEILKEILEENQKKYSREGKKIQIVFS